MLSRASGSFLADKKTRPLKLIQGQRAGVTG